nr:hypothetical protein TDPV-035 [Oriental turtle dovepox virus]
MTQPIHIQCLFIGSIIKSFFLLFLTKRDLINLL